MIYFPISPWKMAPWHSFAEIIGFGRLFKRAHSLLTHRHITPMPHPLPPNVTSCLHWSMESGSHKSSFVFCVLVLVRLNRATALFLCCMERPGKTAVSWLLLTTSHWHGRKKRNSDAIFKKLSLLFPVICLTEEKRVYSTGDAKAFSPPFTLLPEEKEHQVNGIRTVAHLPPFCVGRAWPTTQGELQVAHPRLLMLSVDNT